MTDRPAPALPLTEAAHAIGLSYFATRDRLLRGELEGEKRAGHWYVFKDSLDALREEQGED